MCHKKQIMLPNTGNEVIDSWIEQVNREASGMNVATERLENLILNAPLAVQETPDYFYMLGWLDVVYFLHMGL